MVARIELLDSQHNRADFDCGDTALTEFLRRHAGQQHRRGIGKTYVALDQEGAVQGFVTVSAGSVVVGNFPANLKLPRYPVPILRVGRLAVDLRHRGTGIGLDLLSFALRLAMEVSAKIGLYAVVVEAKNDKAAEFYRRHGFCPTLDDANCLFLPLSWLAKYQGP